MTISLAFMPLRHHLSLPPVGVGDLGLTYLKYDIFDEHLNLKLKLVGKFDRITGK